MNVALIIPPSPFLINPHMFLPLGPLYLSSTLKQHGHQVRVIDLAAGDPMPEVEADVYGISANIATFPYACKVLGQIKERDSSKRVIVGGPMATVDPYACLGVGFDGVVVGEGEKAIIKIAQGCEDQIIQEPPMENLDLAPFPDREALLSGYHADLEGEPCTNIITSRGCPYRCVFCCRIWGSQVRFHSPQYVLREAALIKESYGLKALWFFDDELLLNKPRDFEIFEGLKELGFIFRIFSRSNLIDERTAKILSETGCREVLLGVESASDRIKRIIKKGTTNEVDKKAIRTLDAYGIRVKASLIIGLPGESPETLEETRRFCEEIEDHVADFDFSVLTVYPGTDIFHHPEKFDLEFEAGYQPYKTKPGSYVCSVRTSHLSSEDLLKAREQLEQRFKPKDRLR